MEIQGKVIAVLPERSGVSARVLVFILVRLLTLALILMRMNIRADILIRFVLGTLFVRNSNLLHKVAVLVAMFSLAHKQRNKLWQVLLMLLAWQTRRISKICFHLNSRSNRNLLLHLLMRSLLMTCPSSVELIKRAFNAYVVQSEKCV